MIVSDVAKGSYQLLGRPSQADLPYSDLLVHVGDVVTGRLMDMSLTARNRRMLLSNWTPGTDRVMDVASFGLETSQFFPVKVEMRMADSDEDARPYPVQIVAYETLDTLGSTSINESYCAFYNDYTQIAFSDLISDVENREYRIEYEPLGYRTAGVATLVTDDTRIDDAFLSLCKYEVALRCLDEIQNGTDEWKETRERKKQSFLAVLGQEEGRFKKFNTTQFGSKVIRRQGFRTR
jgi:hypothetical protein